MSSKTLSWDKRCTCCATEHPRMSDSALFVCSSFIATHCNSDNFWGIIWAKLPSSLQNDRCGARRKYFPWSLLILSFNAKHYKNENVCGNFDVKIRRNNWRKKILWALSLWAGRWLESILGYIISKIDEKHNLASEGTKSRLLNQTEKFNWEYELSKACKCVVSEMVAVCIDELFTLQRVTIQSFSLYLFADLEFSAKWRCKQDIQF